MNSIVMTVAFCVFLYGDIFVTALGSDTKDIGDQNALSMPLITDKGAPLVAMLDTKTINRKIKIYIQTLMRNVIQNSVQEQIQGILKKSLEENWTIDFIRNITRQEIKDVLTEKGQEQLVRNEGKSMQDCTEIRKNNPEATSGVYTIFPENQDAVRVYCDMDTDRGGWTIIQRRLDGSVNFQRNWKDYENGFGNVDGEYWLGNKHIHSLTSSSKYKLRIDLTNMSNRKKYAVYETFVIGDAASKYTLTVGDYSGNAGDEMAYHNGMKFSTIDQDNDQGVKCVVSGGPWWHKGCYKSALNRKFNKNLFWLSFSSSRAKTSVMKILKL
ncbi:Fibrinogen-like protein A,Ryncolin-4,Angiopoietin-related protein 1,Ficolin-1-B,Ficolin-2,Ryncolin-1,Tenascin-R,Fibrinogen-like protein 1,Tenascin-X,Fibrinogen C domain-containing protein 1-A,Tenascin-N,Ryncolin-3,Tenascin,Fibroleukin,Fibrinogen C domain-containing protein 1,Angiopoietin-related protein 3,Ryncolin-2,Techylectin-5B,Angiopoietin-related protein 2,Angiopoietin-2,Microfibril-associated glycoprotein 4,Fibrinogen alpha chain,Ficolin-1-A,Ficolin-1,Fibrinogen C domain-containing protein 1-B,Angiop|uniref:Fibrinogen C-terminal domain-containing protein n=1 Tax=Mytilus coruscus TaxID=42192 RepID=A0A6J8A432_MYTCO|nr:Fibrinogen-like protein A,Ryncolin-4,Angiopoietin-related protein 1,Ficolin-1-B,Ficolin-2,Ryncolin-1,Tenascin-R,Fibrinogen-like protein 1,Tenascin-X,Fibrinogen C domain-containing protein 1-A,Tenascin-N,Ryncolin-3,Tenascin,Fibroleukin,Fibrinogen C domain-containing protein 1,Angiopoietin-related protein 3,Ryncolin-2,Techylectin-5B,Angiopoietin-related protein 2,Angiopoietin-2,Microfibril-associated glycoprotein 4,Fibrinogen alpha chain,Ficolin-1-A,Ficolin-1,Fibrinogen C domain-containing protein